MSKKQDTIIKQCSNCFITETSFWRKTKDKNILCNACGVYLNRKKCNRIVHDHNYYAKILIDLYNDTNTS